MPSSPVKILVVDDELLSLRSVTYILEKEGIQYKTAKNGQEALEIAKEDVFDLVLSDLFMPVMDGNELVKRIRFMPEYKYVPFIFLSGSTSEDTWITNLNDGADDFITKPFNKDVLVSKIKAHIKKYRQHKQFLDNQKNRFFREAKEEILYCYEKHSFFEKSKTPFFNRQDITSSNELMDCLSSDIIRVILIDENASWAMDILPKIKEAFSFVPIVYLCNSISCQKSNLYELGINHILLKKTGQKIVINELNEHLKLQIAIKSKYIDALKNAASSTSLKFENSMEFETESICCSLIHHPYDEMPGGDFYEVFHFEDRQLIVFGDVMGKKWNAWFFVHAYIAYIRSTVKFIFNHVENKDLFPSKLLSLLNNSIYKDMQLSEVFTTLCVVCVQPEKKLLKIASAGAMRPFYYNSTQKTTKMLNIVGTLLGVLEDVEYQQLTLNIDSGDRLLFFTDGYSEAIDSSNSKMIGEESVFKVFGDSIEIVSANEMEEKMIEEYSISKFLDDRTMMLLYAK